jgi:hypothetical protein
LQPKAKPEGMAPEAGDRGEFDESVPAEAAAAGEAVTAEIPEDLDISDFDETIEMTPDAEKTEPGEAVSEEMDLDLDLDMDLGEEPAAGEETEAAVDVESEELDFSDFEQTVMLDSPPGPDGDAPSEDITEDLDLDLDLEMEEEPGAEEEPVMPSIDNAEEVELEDLDLEMDLEMEEGGDEAEAVSEEEAAEDIDLSDIEKMLEPESDESVDAEVEKWKQQPDRENFMDETAEIDLSDIVLDAEEMEDLQEAEDEELDLDIDEAVEEEAAEADGELAKEASDIDISELEEFEIPEEEEPVEQNFGSGDIELEFELDGATTPVGVKAFDSAGEPETVAFTAPFIDSEEKKEEAAQKKKPPKIKSGKKSGIATPILIVLILLVLAFAAVIILDRLNMQIPGVSDYVKQIPYVGQLMKSEAVQAGEIRIANITSKFIDNAKHGKFFVIQGTVTNDYPTSRRYIKINGSLFRTGKVLAGEDEVFCGNIISDSDLSKMDLAEIEKRLSNRFGDNRANFEVKPGQEIPFMVVFSGLPDDLEEFAIEVVGSEPVQQ